MDRRIVTTESTFVWFHRITDLILPFVILYGLCSFHSVTWHDRYTIAGIIGGLTFILSAQRTGVYRGWRGRSYFSSIKLIILAWLTTWMALIVLAFLYKDAHNFSRFVFALWAIFTPALLITYRLLIRLLLVQYRLRSDNAKSIAIIGAGEIGRHIAETICKNKWMGYNVVAFFDDNEDLINKEISGIKVIGNTNQITSFVNNRLFEEIFICLPLRDELKIKQLLNKLTDTTLIVKYIPDLFTFDLMHAKWSDINGIPIISVFDTPLSSQSAQLIKRLEDVLLSVIIIVIITPLLLLIAAVVKVTSPGNVIFKQQRYGLNGKKINIYKFRTMVFEGNDITVNQAIKGDKRVTRFGGLLRKTSLDELPQFFNVLQGKMSIVGPRPHATAHNEEFRKLVPKYMQRHLVKPGITGWAQINGWRGETDVIEKMQKRIEFDLHYINNWSLWLDLKIIFLTMLKGFIHKNAY